MLLNRRYDGGGDEIRILIGRVLMRKNNGDRNQTMTKGRNYKDENIETKFELCAVSKDRREKDNSSDGFLPERIRLWEYKDIKYMWIERGKKLQRESAGMVLQNKQVSECQGVR